jgi:hypothetical protein
MSRSPETDPRTPRRQFIGELAAGAAAIAAVACTPSATAKTASQAPAPAPTPGSTTAATAATAASTAGPSESMGPLPTAPKAWDTSWMSRITGKHKAVFDSPEIGEGAALYYAVSYLNSVKDVFGTGDSDASVVVCLRHRAVPLLYNDAMWAKYDIGAMTKTNDPKTSQPATRNVYYQSLDAKGNPKPDDNQSEKIKALAARGVIFVGCDMATRGFSTRVAAAKKLKAQDVYEDIRANLLAGATLMPTGVFATLLAQEAGCSLMKST